MFTTDELTAILALYQQVSLQEKQFASGNIPLEMTFAVFVVVNRIHLAAELGSLPLSVEQQHLLKVLRRVQSLSINGKNLHRICDIDLVCFPNVFSLRLEKLAVRSIQRAPMVVELNLVECSVEEDFFSEAFAALRAVEFERTPVPSKYLASLAFTLRRFTIRHNDTDLDKTVWRLPQADPGAAGLIPWHAVTHVSIKTHRPIFVELDQSWERLANLSNLSLTSMGLSDLKGLDVLKHCLALVCLDLSHNSISSAHRVATFAPHVQRLNVAYNTISTLEGIPDLKDLRQLMLEGNTIHEWAELRDIAEGCSQLEVLNIRGNPIQSQIDDQSEVVPFVASIFQFRRLLVDGVRSEATRSKVTAQFLGKHMGLFQRNRAVDGAFSERMTASPVLIGYRGGGGAASVAAATDVDGAFRRQVLRQGLRSLPSDSGMLRRSTGGVSESPLSVGGVRRRRRVVRGLVQPDKQEQPIALPAPQLETIDRSSAAFVDVEGLAEKHKERWLTAVSAQAAVSQRTKKKKAAAAAAAAAAAEAAASKTATAAANAPQGGVGEAPDAGGNAQPGKKRTLKAVATAVMAMTPHSEAPSRPLPAAAAPGATGPRRAAQKGAAAGGQTAAAAGQSPQGHDDEETIDAAAVAAAISSQLGAGASSGKVAVVSSKAPRQNPQRDPTPLFQSFLNNLASFDWTYVHKEQRIRGFPSGCNLFLSAICVENEAIWGVSEDDQTGPVVHHSAVEVLLHDANDGQHKFAASRHVGKRLVRVVEYHAGYTRTVRVESCIYDDKNSLPQFRGRPITSVNFHTPLSTQPVDPHIDVRCGQARKRGSQLGSRDSELDWADRDIDTSKLSRDILRVSRPTILAAFIVENSPVGDLFLSILKRHVESCHSRLCETKIMREWPLYLDESKVKRDADRSVPVRMTPAIVLERAKNHTDEDVNRQRIGCPEVMISGEELRVNLTTEVFTELARERFLANIYVNIVARESDIDESAALLVITQKTIVLAYDHNYRGRGGAVTTDTAFEKIDMFPVGSLRSVSVSFHLQTVQIKGAVLQTRDSGTTLSIISSLLAATNNTIDVQVRKCPYEEITAAPLLFSVGVFMRPPGKARKPDRETTAFPLRHIEEVMIPAYIVITATDVTALMENDTMTDMVTIRKLDRRPLASIVAFGVAVASLNPLLFSIQYSNLEQGKREQWVFAAQHPNTVSAIYQELRQARGQQMHLIDFTEQQYYQGV